MGRVLINGNPAKAAKQVKENDIITIEYANRTVKAKILKVPTGNVSIQESSTLYELLD
jgi:ribosomal 50S subunit-recycling heat shock protein